jgi:tetratricopeptide (TPR) repeat protein
LDAEKELDNRVLNGFSEAELWRGASNAAQGKWAAAIEHFARAGEIPGDYPRNFSIQLSLLAAEAAIRAEDYRGAGVFLDAIAQGKPTIGEQARLNYLRGRVLYASADIATALSFWRRLTNGTDRWASVRAKRALIEHNLRENTITRPQAIERLERLRFAWRGDQLEFDLLRRLGELYIEEEDFTAGLTSLRQAVTFFPNNIFARSVSKKMTKSFSGIYTDGTSDAMTPLTALALYDQFRELTPVGRRGDKIIQRLADRLVEVDLLDRASVLLDRQVRFRLQGVQKAQVGSRLALIRLLDRQPNTALEALDESVAPGLDPKLALQRKRLRARSVFELGDSETALKLIKSDNDRDADLLRADIFWRTRDWVNAGKVFERLIGNAGRDGRRINDLSAALILNWVVALSMSEQVDALNKVRQIYSTQMDMTEYRDAFRLITNKTEGDMQDFRTLTERFKEIGRFQAFLTSYREKLKTKLLSEMN